MNVHLTNLQQQHDAVVSLDEDLFQQRVESMPQILKVVLKAKWGPTQYERCAANKVACESKHQAELRKQTHDSEHNLIKKNKINKIWSTATHLL